jgi:hypothetical protein
MGRRRVIHIELFRVELLKRIATAGPVMYILLFDILLFMRLSEAQRSSTLEISLNMELYER